MNDAGFAFHESNPELYFLSERMVCVTASID